MIAMLPAARGDVARPPAGALTTSVGAAEKLVHRGGRPIRKDPLSLSLSDQEGKGREGMGGFQRQVKERTMEVKVAVLKGVRVVGDFGKKTWNKVKAIKR
ncbi:hypothetical protein ZWY2020_055413 [Hordeum vulgare]|nr:hypothetical protein ZWY2020_055413 [Hordeum vulgare]